MLKQTLILICVAASWTLPACKSETKGTAFSSGGKNGKKRDATKIDKSKGRPAADVSKPSNAVTKGSFSVWTEPKDPRPGETYQIFIEARMPSSVTSLTAADLSGSVRGTDGYEQSFGNGGSSSDCGGFKGGVESSPDDFAEGPAPSSKPASPSSPSSPSLSSEGYPDPANGGGGGPIGGDFSETGDSGEGFGLLGGPKAAKAKPAGLGLDCGGGVEDFTFRDGVGRLSVYVPGAEDLVRDTVKVRSKVLNEQQTLEIVF